MKKYQGHKISIIHSLFYCEVSRIATKVISLKLNILTIHQTLHFKPNMKKNHTIQLVIMTLLAFASVAISYIYGYNYAKQHFQKNKISR